MMIVREVVQKEHALVHNTKWHIFPPCMGLGRTKLEFIGYGL